MLGCPPHALEDGVPYEFRDLRDDRVAECSKSVHPIGKPINNSEKAGSNFVVVFTGSPRVLAIQLPSPYEPPPFFRCPEPFLPSQCRGVGNNPEAFSRVRGTKGGSRNAIPPCVIPDGGQVAENSSQSAASKSCGILHDCEFGSKLANKAMVFLPEARTSTIDSGAIAGAADILAGEPAADDIDGNSVSLQSIGCEGSDIFILLYVGPMLRQNLPAERVDLAERLRLEASRPFEAEREAANAAEQVQHAELAR